MIQVPCGECGNSLKRWASKLKERKYGSFCNRTCLGKFRTRVLVGELGANFRQGVKKDREYLMVMAPWHPFSVKGYVALHRLIAESRMGRFLSDGEIVHHKDHDKRNNHWDNLEVMTQAEHAREHLELRGRDPKTGRMK